MNDQYNTIIEHRGRLYRYDPDFDCFYPVEPEITGWKQWSWIVLILVLALIAYIVSQ